MNAIRCLRWNFLPRLKIFHPRAKNEKEICAMKNHKGKNHPRRKRAFLDLP